MKAMRLFLIVTTLLAGMAFAQAGSQNALPLSDTDIALLRQDLQSTRMDIVTKNMQFTPQQASAFWPVYREYTQEMQPIGDKEVSLIKEYARTYNTMTDQQASDLTKQLMTIRQDEVDLRKKYFPKFEKAVGGKTAAKFYQVDSRINLLVNLQLASNIPMIQ